MTVQETQKPSIDMSVLAPLIIIDKEEWIEILTRVLPSKGIDTKMRVAAFMAQVAHESAGLKLVLENPNYSAAALQKVFRKYFPTPALASEYARKPARIANRAYAGRMGNGDEDSGDGFRFRGRGLIQVTGKNNYRSCSIFLFGDERLLTDPSYLETKEGALMSACWYWTANELNKFADSGDFVTLTKRINGGTIGMADREEKYKKAKTLLGI